MRKGVTIKHLKPINGDQLWRCLISCGCAIFIKPRHVLICQRDDDRMPYFSFCENLERRRLEVKAKGLSETKLDASFKLRPISGRGQLFLRSENLAETSEAWRRFLANKDIREARCKLRWKKGPVKVRDLVLSGSLACNITIREDTKLFACEQEFLEYVSDKWKDQNSKICRSVKSERESELIMSEFQKLVVFLYGARGSFMDKYGRLLTTFLRSIHSNTVSGVDAYNEMKALLGKNQTAASIEKLLAFWDDALEKATAMFNEDSDSDIEPLIMRLAFMRTTVILSFIFEAAFSKSCENHINSDDIKEAERRLKTIKRLTNELSKNRRKYPEAWKAKRRDDVLNSIQSMSFNPFKHCVACRLDDFSSASHTLRELRRQLEEVSAVKESSLKGSDKPKNNIVQKESLKAVGKSVQKKSPSAASWLRQTLLCSLKGPIELDEEEAGLTQEENLLRNIEAVQTELSEKLSQDRFITLKHAVRCALMKLVSGSPEEAESASQTPTETSPLLESKQFYQLQRFLLTEATKEEVYRTLVKLRPFLSAMGLEISQTGMWNIKGLTVLENGLTFPEMVAWILNLCNSMAMTSDHESAHRYTIYTRLSELVTLVKRMESKNGFNADPSMFASFCRRFQLRALANGGDWSELLKLVRHIVDKMEETNEELGCELEEDIQATTIISDFNKALLKATEVLEQFDRYITQGTRIVVDKDGF